MQAGTACLITRGRADFRDRGWETPDDICGTR
jgi:hypothetical protein